MAGLLEPRKPTRGLLDIAKYGDGGLLSSYEPSLRDKVNYWLADHWYGDTRQGVEQAKNLSNVLETVTPYGLLTGAYDAGRAGGSGDYLGAGIAGAMTALPLPAPVEKEAKQGIRAFHGSPHSFDRFSMDKIGTGEGAQAYGHGLYFAENEGVAKNYRDQLAQWTQPDADIVAKYQPVFDGLSHKISEAVGKNDFDTAYKLRAEQLQIDRDMQTEMAKRGKPSGSMYEVRINANPDDFLDWDKPFASADDVERFAAKFDAVDPVLRKRIEDYGYMRQQMGQPMPDGNDIVRELLGGIGNYNSVRATDTMREAGIPGIKYLDAGSRGTSGGELLGIQKDGNGYRAKIKKFGGGAIGSAPTDMVTTSKPFASEQEARKWAEGQIASGTRNYVVFDDKLIEIVRKYGIAGATSLLGYNFMQELTPAQQNQLKMIEG